MESSSSHTYVFNPESPTEMARLINQDRILTQSMGGPFSGLSDTSSLGNILDLGCGPGGWVLDVAFALPEAAVKGVDISHIMIDYANTCARTRQLPNASFAVMDISRSFDFPDASFDLVNARTLFAVLKRDSWPAFLRECRRVLRPGGFLRLSEPLDFGHTSSAAVNRIGSLCTQVITQAGYGFAPDGTFFGFTHLMTHWLQEQGYQHIHRQANTLDFSAHADAWAGQYHNIEVLCYQLKPLIVKQGLIAEVAFDRLQQQALADMQREDFFALGFSLTVVGQKQGQ
jgi:ubiquinone/menaquinone biosynthesis C-methylase UbiE